MFLNVIVVNLLEIILNIQLQVTLSTLDFSIVFLMALKEISSKAPSISRKVPRTKPFFAIRRSIM